VIGVTAEPSEPHVLRVARYPVKSMGGEALPVAELGPRGLLFDREYAVYGEDGKLASGKHSRRFRRMDPVFDLVAAKRAGSTVVTLADGTDVVVGQPDSNAVLSQHFGEQVRLLRETDVMHQDQAQLSIVGSATLDELGRHEGDGRPLDPRHLRVNVLVRTDRPYAEEDWVGHDLAIGPVRVHVLEPIERCRMVGVAQFGLPARGGMLKTISEHHDLLAGVYASVVHTGTISVGDVVAVH
jgi:uncharacterized protein YcbX